MSNTKVENKTRIEANNKVERISSKSIFESAPHSIKVRNASAQFGTSIAMSGKTVYVGDPTKSQVTEFSRTPSGAWKTSEVIQAPGGVQGFGYDLALDGNTLIIGAYSGVQREDGAVFQYRAGSPVKMLAQSDNKTLVGFSVAAHFGDIAYARRARNDPERQSGSVIVLSNGAATEYRNDQNPDYFGATISLYNNQLLVAAPAYGAHGSALLYDINKGPTIKSVFSIPAGMGTANVENEVLIGAGICMISGAGSRNGKLSAVWSGCNPKRLSTLNATGHIDVASGRIAFSGPAAIPEFGQLGPFSVGVFGTGNLSQPIAQIKSPTLERSLTRNMALSDERMAVALINASGQAVLEIYETNR